VFGGNDFCCILCGENVTEASLYLTAQSFPPFNSETILLLTLSLMGCVCVYLMVILFVGVNDD